MIEKAHAMVEVLVGNPGFCWREASAGFILHAKIVCWEAYMLKPMCYRFGYDHDAAMSRALFDCF
jgi:hypothetical protein